MCDLELKGEVVQVSMILYCCHTVLAYCVSGYFAEKAL